jgi:hypothetical protein
LNRFQEAQHHIIEQFKTCDLPVHFSFDMWTSPNHRAFFGLVGHWIDSIGILRCALLGLERFKGAHTGANQATVIWNIINQYELHHRIGYFTTDNASNNDTALQELAKILEEHNITCSPKQSRV